MRKSNQLTVKTVEALLREARETGKPRKKNDGNGLLFLARPNGYWVRRYRVAKRSHDLPLGPYPLIGLAEARSLNLEAQRLQLKGLDPLEERRADRRRLYLRTEGATFGAVAEQFIANHASSWRSKKHADQWRNTLQTYCAPINDVPVQVLDTPAILRVLSPLWATKVETGKRLQLRIERIIDYARAAGLSTGPNPATWRGHLDKLLPSPGKVAASQHMPAMAWREVPAFMVRLRAVDTVAARALETLILCGSRTREVLGMRWEEIDLDQATWTLPPARMKSHREHVVPLPLRVLTILNTLRRENGGYIFTLNGERPLSPDMMRKQLRRLGLAVETTHGFRASFRSWAADQTHFPREVAEMCLAHVTASKVERSYQRSNLLEQRRALQQQWANFCESSGKPDATVVPLTLSGAAAHG